MREAIPIGVTGDRPRSRGLVHAAVRAVRLAGQVLARLNGTHTPAAVHAADMAQLRRAMRD